MDLREREKVNYVELFTSLRSVHMVKNCDQGLENAALSLQPWAAFSRPWLLFFLLYQPPKYQVAYTGMSFSTGVW